MNQLLDTHRDAQVIHSLPGLGGVVAARLLAEFGDVPGWFTDAKARKAYAGTALLPAKYWLSTLPADTPLPKLVRLAEIRWRVEHEDREPKTALGPAHFEGRTWPGLHHHLALITAAHAFCTLERLHPRPATG